MALESGPKTEAEDRRHRTRAGQVTLAASLLVCGLAGCATSRESKAEADFRTVQNESNAKNLFDRGRAFAFVGDFTRAEEYLAAALDAGADPREVLPLLMDVCVRGGRYRSAIQHGENHLRRHPADLRTHLMVGALYAAIDEPERATEHLQQVVERPMPPPELLHGEAHYYLGIVARDRKDWVGADQHFREYLRIEPNGKHVEEAKGSLLKQVPQPPPDGSAKDAKGEGAKP
ncbi:MAG: tetratricopeptide repeat protein [Labilithrix sp.]